MKDEDNQKNLISGRYLGKPLPETTESLRKSDFYGGIPSRIFSYCVILGLIWLTDFLKSGKPTRKNGGEKQE
jgi:hypothetical protein